MDAYYDVALTILDGDAWSLLALAGKLPDEAKKTELLAFHERRTREAAAAAAAGEAEAAAAARAAALAAEAESTARRLDRVASLREVPRKAGLPLKDTQFRALRRQALLRLRAGAAVRGVGGPAGVSETRFLNRKIGVHISGSTGQS